MKFRKYLSLSVIAVLLIYVTGCTKSADMAGKLNTETSSAAQEETESISTEELLLNDTVETGQITTQEPAGTAGVSGEQITASEATAESETVPEEPTAPSDEVVTEPVTEPAAEVVIPTQKETTGPKDTESVTTEPTQLVTQKPTQPVTATPTQPATQKPTEVVTQAPTKPATQKPTEAPTQKPTEVQTTAPAPTEEATTVNAAIAERDAFIEEWYHEAYAYPWDFEYIEAELRAYGESLGMTYETEEYVESLWYDNPQVQQWWTLEEWMSDGLLTPDNASWTVPERMSFDDNEYMVARHKYDSYDELDRLATRGITTFRIYFELDATGKYCTVYTLY